MNNSFTYSDGIREAFEYLLNNHEEVFVIGQGLWSPWYVGNTMNELDKKFGVDRIIDTPVSESAVTGAAVGAALSGMRPIVVHPRIDFMLYAMDAVVNQAAKWRHMTGGQASVPMTIRAIINRGGEQGAQHSQALHSWFAHIPGLKVVMPYSPLDARDLFIASVLDNNPVLFHDDRWLYETASDYYPPELTPLSDSKAKIINQGKDITIVASGYTTHLSMLAAASLSSKGVSAEVIDLRVLNPIDPKIILDSIQKTQNLLVVDGGWSPCSISSEILALAVESEFASSLKKAKRITLPFSPAPTASRLEEIYYPNQSDIENFVIKLLLN